MADSSTTTSESPALAAEQINIEIAFALPTKQTLLARQMPAGLTVEEIITRSGILDLYEEIDIKVNKVGIWNRTCKLKDIPKNGDRIEIYRPLIADPKESRRRRAEKAKEEGRANKITGGRAK